MMDINPKKRVVVGWKRIPLGKATLLEGEMKVIINARTHDFIELQYLIVQSDLTQLYCYHS